MSPRNLLVLCSVLVLAFGGQLAAQDEPFGVGLVGNFDQANNYADVWAEGNFAYLARFGSNVIDIVDIANPAAPVLVATYNTGVGGASAQDVEVEDGLMFVGLEGVSPGAQIVDVRDPFNPVRLTDVTVLSAVHNVFYNEGWLYLVDSATDRVFIVDLTDYDPNNAPGVISQETYRLNNVGNLFVHDVTALDGRLYASAWNTLEVFDITNIANQAPVNIGSAPGNSVHAAWPTDDGQFVVVTEERGGGGMTLFEIVPDGQGIDVVQRDTFVFGDEASSAHNPFVVGDTVYVSWYEAGLQVFEIDRNAKQFTRVAAYDTTSLDGTNSFFGGAWGVYPGLGADRVLVSDRREGLFILDVDPSILQFSYPNGQPETVPPDSMSPIEVEVIEVGSPLNRNSVTLSSSVDGVDQPDAMMQESGPLFEADLPQASCGSVIEYSVSAENADGDLFLDPRDGSAYRVDVAEGISTVFFDDFDANLGWQVSNTDLDSGAWERGDPRGTGAQPEDCFSGDSCYFTGQGPIGGDSGDADVDGGPTRMTSPSFDFSGGDGAIRYVYWFSNDDGDDSMVVELSSNGGSWVEAKRYTGGGGGWVEDMVIVGDTVNPTSDIRIRFLVSDNPNDSVTEGAIDDVRAEVFDCEPGGGGNVNLTVGEVVRGEMTTLTVTGAEAFEVVTFTGSIVGIGSGPCLDVLGGLCLDLENPIVVGSDTADANGTAVLDVPIPDGLPADQIWFQGVIQRGPGGADSVTSEPVQQDVN